MNLCQFCKSEIRKQDKFCIGCGAPVTVYENLDWEQETFRDNYIPEEEYGVQQHGKREISPVLEDVSEFSYGKREILNQSPEFQQMQRDGFPYPVRGKREIPSTQAGHRDTFEPEESVSQSMLRGKREITESMYEHSSHGESIGEMEQDSVVHSRNNFDREVAEFQRNESHSSFDNNISNHSPRSEVTPSRIQDHRGSGQDMGDTFTFSTAKGILKEELQDYSPPSLDFSEQSYGRREFLNQGIQREKNVLSETDQGSNEVTKGKPLVDSVIEKDFTSLHQVAFSEEQKFDLPLVKSEQTNLEEMKDPLEEKSQDESQRVISSQIKVIPPVNPKFSLDETLGEKMGEGASLNWDDFYESLESNQDFSRESLGRSVTTSPAETEKMPEMYQGNGSGNNGFGQMANFSEQSTKELPMIPSDVDLHGTKEIPNFSKDGIFRREQQTLRQADNKNLSDYSFASVQENRAINREGTLQTHESRSRPQENVLRYRESPPLNHENVDRTQVNELRNRESPNMAHEYVDRTQENVLRNQESPPMVHENVERTRENILRNQESPTMAYEYVDRTQENVLRNQESPPMVYENVDRTQVNALRNRESPPMVHENMDRTRENILRNRESPPMVHENVDRTQVNALRNRESPPMVQENLRQTQDLVYREAGALIREKEEILARPDLSFMMADEVPNFKRPISQERRERLERTAELPSLKKVQRVDTSNNPLKGSIPPEKVEESRISKENLNLVQDFLDGNLKKSHEENDVTPPNATEVKVSESAVSSEVVDRKTKTVSNEFPKNTGELPLFVDADLLEDEKGNKRLKQKTQKLPKLTEEQMRGKRAVYDHESTQEEVFMSGDKDLEKKPEPLPEKVSNGKVKQPEEKLGKKLHHIDEIPKEEFHKVEKSLGKVYYHYDTDDIWSMANKKQSLLQFIFISTLCAAGVAFLQFDTLTTERFSNFDGQMTLLLFILAFFTSLFHGVEVNLMGKLAADLAYQKEQLSVCKYGLYGVHDGKGFALTYDKIKKISVQPHIDISGAKSRGFFPFVNEDGNTSFRLKQGKVLVIILSSGESYSFHFLGNIDRLVSEIPAFAKLYLGEVGSFLKKRMLTEEESGPLPEAVARIQLTEYHTVFNVIFIIIFVIIIYFTL